MDRSYLESFNDDQLLNYKNTLKRRIKDLRELTVELTSENQELGQLYEELIHQKTHIYHQAEKKKKSWGNWLNKGKEKIGTFLHITKKPEDIPKNEQVSEQKPKEGENYYVAPENEDERWSDTPPKSKVMNILEKGKEKITKLFSSNKASNEDDKFALQYDAPDKKFGYLSEMVKQNTFHPQSRYNQILQRMEQKNIVLDSSSFTKKEQVKQESRDEGLRQKKQLSSFQKITKQELHQSESKQNCSVKIQTTSFQPELTEEVVKPFEENEGNKKEAQEKKDTQQNSSKDKKQEDQVKESKKQNEDQKESPLINEVKEKEIAVPQNPSNKQGAMIGPAEEDEENEYAVHYDQPEKNYQLQQGELSQIVEKYAPNTVEASSDPSVKKQSVAAGKEKEETQ